MLNCMPKIRRQIVSILKDADNEELKVKIENLIRKFVEYVQVEVKTCQLAVEFCETPQNSKLEQLEALEKLFESFQMLESDKVYALGDIIVATKDLKDNLEK